MDKDQNFNSNRSVEKQAFPAKNLNLHANNQQKINDWSYNINPITLGKTKKVENIPSAEDARSMVSPARCNFENFNQSSNSKFVF